MNYDFNDFFDDLIITTDLDNRILKINRFFQKITEDIKPSVIGKKESDVLNIIYSSESKNENENLPLIFEEIIEIKGEKNYFKTKKEILINENTKEEHFLITRRNITEFKQNIILYEEHKKLLEYIAKAKPIGFILDEIIKSVESKNNNILCSILLLDESKKRLIKGSAPSLPDFYNEKIDRILIGKDIGSCGASVYLKQRVVIENIATHKNWENSRAIALKANLHACWSQPFFSSKNEVLGSFAIYYNKPKKPSLFDIQLIEDIANITGLAVEKHNNYIKAKKNEEEKKEKEQLLMHKTKQAMMGEMLENIAHQWRQPLSIISTYATGILMKKKCGIDTKDLESEAFENINLNAQYLSNTIDDFRKYLIYNKESSNFKIIDALNHTLKLVDSRIKTENIKVIENIKDITIFNFENELIQVFMNIFNNSIDVLMEIDNKEERYIFIDVKRRQKNLIIKISDSGNGTTDTIIKRMFEPYFTTKSQKLGTGIGLYMCQEIIEKHMKGYIKAQNSQRKVANKKYIGLEFEIIIPINVKE
uniref:ATP-binding protein n=1 Tax=Aliarcobacter sp. TaxID=2321116 RepID=UPI0040487521